MADFAVDIVIPVLNQLHYTKVCLDYLLSRPPSAVPVRIIMIDNGSSDGTGDYLKQLEGVTVITNTENRGCAAAWNQGMAAGMNPWVVFLNNDVLLPGYWLEGLLACAESEELAVVSPAMREGCADYNVEEHARLFIKKMHRARRYGDAHGVCFMVKRELFDRVGLFDEQFRIGQFEDSDFFRRARNAGYRLAITGSSFIHHFGSVTQKEIRKDKNVRPYEAENRTYYRKKWHLVWWRRLGERLWGKLKNLLWVFQERICYGYSLKEQWLSGRVRHY